jgi:hypothetical protein
MDFLTPSMKSKVPLGNRQEDKLAREDGHFKHSKKLTKQEEKGMEFPLLKEDHMLCIMAN